VPEARLILRLGDKSSIIDSFPSRRGIQVGNQQLPIKIKYSSWLYS